MPYKTPVLSPDWVKVTEAAARLNVHPKTVYGWARTGRIPIRTMRFDRALRLHRGDLDAYLAQRSAPVATSA